MHLELVSSLSTDAFIAALARFVARRGVCAHMFSDNGTNFVGADRILQGNFKHVCQTHAVNTFLAENSIQWHFIPASAPHFGGLWEAAVKSAIQHLARVAANASLTY